MQKKDPKTFSDMKTQSESDEDFEPAVPKSKNGPKRLSLKEILYRWAGSETVVIFARCLKGSANKLLIVLKDPPATPFHLIPPLRQKSIVKETH